MIRDRYDPLDLFALVPQLQLQFEPELAVMDRLLDDDALFQHVKADLAQRRPQSAVTGRPATPVEVILRLLVVKHLYGWSYEQTEHFVNDSLVLRQFCRLYLEPVPDDTTLLRWANLIQPQTLQLLLDRVTELACSLKVTRGRKLRTDTTVVETDIHHPADSTLLADGVRVLSRLVRRARAVVETSASPVRALLRDRTRSAIRLARRIGATMVHGRQGSEQERRRLYQRLLRVTRASLRQAQQVRELVAAGPEHGAQGLWAELERFLPLVEQVISQTERRVLRGEAVPATEKLLSLFEPHTALIRRGKARQPTEFGRKVVLDEVEGGLVTRYAILAGNPPDATCLPDSLEHHRARFGRPPDLVTADRSFTTAPNRVLAQAQGVRRVALPARGGRRAKDRAVERQRWFRRAYRFRAGSEGRISVLRRRFGLERCRHHGEAGGALSGSSSAQEQGAGRDERSTGAEPIGSPGAFCTTNYASALFRKGDTQNSAGADDDGVAGGFRSRAWRAD
jgi:IS5 family transposase